MQLSPLNQGLLQLQGELYPIQTIFNHRSRDQLLEFCMSFYETISSEFLGQGNFKHTQFSREHWYWQDSNSQPLVPKASSVSIELTWLLHCEPLTWQMNAQSHRLMKTQIGHARDFAWYRGQRPSPARLDSVTQAF